MRRLVFSVMVLVGLGALPSVGHAQFVGDAALTDPFLAYYGFFLPRQAALAARPGPELSINQLSAARQVAAITERAGLYEPPAGLGVEGYDPNRPFANQSAFNRRSISRNGLSNGNISGNGPGEYYNRAATYYPGLRVGRGTNANIATTTSHSRGRGSNRAANVGNIRGQMNPRSGMNAGLGLGQGR
jgi:hypothetical protein